MAEESTKEDTFTLILTSMNHPLRRKILRVLSHGPLDFSQIREALTIDADQLNSCIRSLGELVTRSEEGKYLLSTAGRTAFELMGSVEEQGQIATVSRNKRRIRRMAIILSAILSIALLMTAAYALTYTTQDRSVLFDAQQDAEELSMTIPPSQQLNYTISLNLCDMDTAVGYSVGRDKAVVSIPQTTNNIVQWTKYVSNSRLNANGTYAINFTIYDPDSRILVNHREDGNISSPQNILHDFELSKPGEYTLQVGNLGKEDFTGALVPNGVQVNYSRPLFNYAVIGISAPQLLLILFLLYWGLYNKRRPYDSSRRF